MDLPSRVTQEWLDELPLLEFFDDIDDDYGNDILQKLADIVERGEAYEEFKVGFSLFLPTLAVKALLI